MPKYEVSQRFNNGSARNYQRIETDALTLQPLIDAAPKGVTVYGPTLTGVSGTARPVPTVYVSAKAICKDRTDQINSVSFVDIKYGKDTLDDDAIVTALLGKVEVPNGSSCDSVSVKNWRKVGA